MQHLRQIGLVTDEQRPRVRARPPPQRQRLVRVDPSPIGGCRTGSTPSASQASTAVSRARTFGLVKTSPNVMPSAASALPASRDCASPRSVSRRSGSGRASCGSASPWRSSQSWAGHAPASTRARTRESASRVRTVAVGRGPAQPPPAAAAVGGTQREGPSGVGGDVAQRPPRAGALLDLQLGGHGRGRGAHPSPDRDLGFLVSHRRAAAASRRATASPCPSANRRPDSNPPNWSGPVGGSSRSRYCENDATRWLERAMRSEIAWYSGWRASGTPWMSSGRTGCRTRSARSAGCAGPRRPSPRGRAPS